LLRLSSFRGWHIYYSVYAPVSDIPNQIISNFWQTCEISDCTILIVGYIHDIIRNRLENNFLKIEAKAHSPSASSMLTIQIWNTKIKEQLCSCTRV